MSTCGAIRRGAALKAGAALALDVSAVASAQSWPAKPVRIVVPSTPDGTPLRSGT